MTEEQLTELRGLVATVVLTGSVDELYAAAHEEMRVFNERHGFRHIEYKKESAQLVEAGRDAVCMHAMNEGYDWVLQVDADAAPIPPDALVRTLVNAYTRVPDADAIGGYCQLRHPPYLPTIDRGSGTWEEIYPGEGLVPVIRTGGHFLFLKRSALERFGPPWFRTRQTARPIQAFAEIDGYARQKKSGKNPLANTLAWKELTESARAESAEQSSVGEDSGFCDALLAAGGRIYVDTDLVIGHVAKRIISPQMLREEMDKRRARISLACGILDKA